MNPYQQWLEGKVNSGEVLETLCHRLDDIQAQKANWETQEKILRAELSEVVTKGYGGKIEVEWFGKLEITRSRVVDSYEAGKVDHILAQLVAEGHRLGQELALARKQTTYAGGLRVTRLKEDK
jgi:hypothetical protein